ncbi:hypothetical protein [Pseudomonas fluorescens]|uniref:hypothetical protein n=1 Tax=Pseudomonas fluorescens TaxID=294 RepID=UPI0012F62BF6|nr:hypothetical protein [Pseudomonas fluorescens]
MFSAQDSFFENAEPQFFKGAVDQLESEDLERMWGAAGAEEYFPGEPILCRSEPARDSGGTGNTQAD